MGSGRASSKGQGAERAEEAKGAKEAEEVKGAKEAEGLKDRRTEGQKGGKAERTQFPLLAHA